MTEFAFSRMCLPSSLSNVQGRHGARGDGAWRKTPSGAGTGTRSLYSASSCSSMFRIASTSDLWQLGKGDDGVCLLQDPSALLLVVKGTGMELGVAVLGTEHPLAPAREPVRYVELLPAQSGQTKMN